MNRYLKLTALVLLTSSTGCTYLAGDDGYFRDRRSDYLESPTVPPLQVPPTLDSFTLQETFPVPPPDSVEGGTFQVPPPPREIDTRAREGVVVQRFGDRRWILIGATPGQVWPRLRDFWTTAQLPVARENALEGVMETDWLPTNENGREKYLVRIEPGLHAGNSEVYVVQVFESELGAQAPGEVGESHDIERESAMLDAVSIYLADRTDLYRASSVSLLAGSIESDSKARVVRNSENALNLQLRIDYERAWGQVGQSLNSTPGATIIDSDQQAGTLTVSYTGPQEEEEPGFFGRLFSRDDDSGEAGMTFTVRLNQQADNVITVSAQPALSDVGEAGAQRRNELIQALYDNLT